MFYRCENLEEIIFPQNEKAENLGVFNDMFAKCKNLKTLDLSNFSFKKGYEDVKFPINIPKII